MFFKDEFLKKNNIPGGKRQSRWQTTSILFCQTKTEVESKICAGEQVSGWRVTRPPSTSTVLYDHFLSTNFLFEPLAWVKGHLGSLRGSFLEQGNNQGFLVFSFHFSPAQHSPLERSSGGGEFAATAQLWHSCQVSGLEVQTWDLVLVVQLLIPHGSLKGSLAPSALLRICIYEWAG